MNYGKLLGEFIYTFLKFYRVLCYLNILIKFLPAISRFNLLNRIVRSITAGYFKLFKIRKLKGFLVRYVSIVMPIRILDLIVELFSTYF